MYQVKVIALCVGGVLSFSSRCYGSRGDLSLMAEHQVVILGGVGSNPTGHTTQASMS